MSTPVNVLRFTSSQLCPKCSGANLYRWYEAALDVLVFDCTGDRGCGHRFCTDPQDAPPRSKGDTTVRRVELPALEPADEAEDDDTEATAGEPQ